jgi:ATP-dependent RNA helicase DDX19/DBP5
MSTTEETPIKHEPTEETPVQGSQDPQEDSLEKAQTDGSGPPGNGSALAEAEYKVEVKLADLQADPNNPLYSVKSFEELKL